MSDPIVNQIQKWIEDHHDDLLNDYREMLQIPSLEDTAEPGAPFGKANKQALDLALKWCEDSGMTSTDLDGYCGYGEFGSGEKMVITLGHLDVVPVGPGWKHEPFGAEIDQGWVYARGAVDDKGPTVAMFYAAKALKEIVGDPGVRVRSLFGSNEESGFKCVEHYMKVDEAPTIGVAPDAGWPCIHGEKGICDFVISRSLPKGEMTLLEINGGQRPNIVIDSCLAKVSFSDSYLDEAKSRIEDSWDNNLKLSWEGNILVLEAVGKAAHGSIPFWGDSAAIRVLRFLREIAPLSQAEEYAELFEVPHIGGNGIGIACADEQSGSLTCNLGIIQSDSELLSMTLNIRYPVTKKGEDLKETCQRYLDELEGDYVIAGFSDNAPLYFPIDHALVKTICEVYTAETGNDKKPGTMGGGTYARAIPNCVAIGTGWEGDGPAHETDERLKVEHLYKMARIYGHLLYRLTQVAKDLP